MPYGFFRLSPGRSGGASSASADATGKFYTATGLKVGSAAILYGNGTQVASATVDSLGKATWTLASAPTPGTVVTYDGTVTGSGGTVPVPPTLAALVLSGSAFTAGSAPGTVIGTISGQTSGSTITFTPNDGRVVVSSSALVVGMAATAAGMISGTLVETLSGATGSPRSTLVTISINAGAPTLGALTVSAGTATVGTAYTSTISGQTSGSALSLTGGGASGLSISGATISGTPTTAGAVNVVETLAGATNSPRTTSGLVTVAAAASVTLNALTVSNGSATVGAAYTGTVSGQTSGSTLSLTGAGAAGLSISGASISGTPTTVGSVNVVETLSGATNSPRTTSGLITVAAAVASALVFGSPPPAYRGVPYSWQPLFVGPAGTQSWTNTLSLVAGLTQNATTGLVSGTPTATGTITGSVSATAGGAMGTLSNISFTSQEFYKQYTVSGVDPVRAFDYRNNLYWDGSAVTNSVTAFLTGATVTAGKGLLPRLNIASTGAHLTGHQLAAKTVVMQLSGGSTTGGDGILSYGGDAPLYRNGASGNSYVNSLRSYRVSGTAILDSMAPSTAVGGLANDGGSTTTTTKWSVPNWTKRARVATALNASGRKTTIGGSGIIHSDSNAFASPTAVTLLSFGGGYVYGGNDNGQGGGTTTPANSYLETEVIYGSYLSDADFVAAAAPRDFFEGKSGLAFPTRSYVAPLDTNNSLKYSKTQPWYAYAIARADAYPVGLAATGNYHAGIIWTNSAGNPNGGYEGWIDGDGKLRVRIMSNFGGGDYLGVIGTTSIIDGVTHEIEYFYDGSGSTTGIKIALDGVFETLTKEPGSANTLTGDIIANAAPYTVGNQLIGAGGSSEWQQAFMWPGRLDCFVQEKAARTTPFATGKFTPPPVTAGVTELYYLFNEGTGTTVADLSGNNRTGTLSGQNIPVWVGG